MLKTAAMAVGGVAILGAPALMRGPADRVLVVAFPGAASGEAVRAGLEGGGLLVSMAADGRAAIFDVATGIPFRPSGAVITMRSSEAAGCAKSAK